MATNPGNAERHVLAADGPAPDRTGSRRPFPEVVAAIRSLRISRTSIYRAEAACKRPGRKGWDRAHQPAWARRAL